MAHQPVQVVLNPEALRAPRDQPTPNGNGTDFYRGARDAFASHRDELATSIRQVLSLLEREKTEGRPGLAYLKVVMREDAIAKSHRPQKRLFPSRWSPHVATAGIGEPIYAVTPASLRKTLDAVLKAETEVGVKPDTRTGEVVPNPSRNRCEVSAIASVEIWGAADKRAFSAADAATWLSRSGTGSGYIVELFPVVTADQNPELRESEDVAVEDLRRLGGTAGVEVLAVRERDDKRTRALAIRVIREAGADPLSISASTRAVDASSDISIADPGSEAARLQQRLLERLSQNPLVRSIGLPPVISRDARPTAGEPATAPPELFARDAESSNFGKVGVIDGGVAGPIESWVERRWGQLAEADRDPNHGTFIAGLLVAGGQLNQPLSDQRHGCLVYDVDVLPSDPGGTNDAFDQYYPGGVVEFLDEVEEAIGTFRRDHGVRVFNLSLNFTSPGDAGRYGYAAQRLDDIAAKHGVIFVISAGNLGNHERRLEWNLDPGEALASLVADTSGVLSEPGESLFNVSVSALNPPGLEGQVPWALTNYSRRGPGLRGAIKPDFAHIGGSGTPTSSQGSGLYSLDAAGNVRDDAGTSFAAPLVARRLADLDALIEGDVSRETLLALMVHHSRAPEVMRQRPIASIAKDLVGFGVPANAEDILQHDDSEITLVFNSVLQPREQASLIFAWPESLVSGGKCRGYARLTLVATPILSYAHGDERIRVNVGARLMQENAAGGWENRVQPVYPTPQTASSGQSERDLLREAMKWQVVKSFEARLTGRGPSSNWKFVVDYLTRAEEQLPDSGVGFAAVLTISDPKRSAPVFQEVRQSLMQLGIQTDDIRTSLRTRVQP